RRGIQPLSAGSTSTMKTVRRMRWGLGSGLNQVHHVTTAARRPRRDGGGEDVGELVVAGSDAPPVLQSAEHALDEIALSVEGAMEGVRVFAGWVVRDHGEGSPGDEESRRPL